jgi:ribosomal protein S18 acetylase RimI-like enzyme
VNREDLYRRMLANMEVFYRGVARSPTCSLVEREGVVACVCPPAGDRSFFNAVVYRDGAALRAMVDELDRAYVAGGVRAWTVWAPEEDADTAAALEVAGHRLDAEPRAMAAPLGEIDVGVGAGGVDWRAAEDLAPFAPIVGPAFGVAPGVAAAASAGLERVVRLYVARMDGEDVATAGTIDVDGDCGVYMVATRERARGRGLATALMRQALLDAGRRGLETTSLQATRMGRPIYERLGYRDLGALQMWERRRPAG